MRQVSFCLLLLFLLPLLASPQGLPIPPGVVEANKRASEPLPSAKPLQPKGIDPAQLRREADELSRLAAELPQQIDQVTRGQLPKDLGDSLKRIEKLAKHLRSEISP